MNFRPFLILLVMFFGLHAAETSPDKQTTKLNSLIARFNQLKQEAQATKERIQGSRKKRVNKEKENLAVEVTWATRPNREKWDVRDLAQNLRELEALEAQIIPLSKELDRPVNISTSLSPAKGSPYYRHYRSPLAKRPTPLGSPTKSPLRLQIRRAPIALPASLTQQSSSSQPVSTVQNSPIVRNTGFDGFSQMSEISSFGPSAETPQASSSNEVRRNLLGSFDEAA